MEGWGGELPSPPPTNPSNAKRMTHYSAMPLLVRTAIFQFVSCNLKENREKREIGTSNIEVNCG